MIDTSAFDRFKNQRKAGLPNQIDISAFGYEWNEPATTPRPAEPQGLLQQLPGVAWDKIKEKWGEYQANDEEFRRTHTLGQEAYRDLIERPAKIVKFALADLPRYVLGTIPNVTQSVAEFVWSPVLGKEYVRENFQLMGGNKKLEKLLFGDEIRSYQELSESVTKAVEQSPDAKPWEKKYVGPAVGMVALIADIWPPGKGAPKGSLMKLVEELVVETTEKGAYKAMIEKGIPEAIAREVAPKIPTANTPEAVRNVIGETSQDLLAILTKETVPPPVSKTAERIAEETPPVAGRAGATQDALAKRVVTQATEATNELAKQAAKFDNLDDFLRTADENLDGIVPEWGTKNQYLKKNPFVKEEGGIGKKGQQWELEQVLKEKPAFLNSLLETKYLKEFAKKNGLVYLKSGSDEIVAKTMADAKRVAEANGARELGLALGYQDLGRAYKESDLVDIWKSTHPNAANTSRIPDTAPTVEYKGEKVKVNDVAPEYKVKATEEELKPLKEMAARDSSRLQPVRATGKTTGRDLAQEIIDREKKFEAKMSDPEIAAIREQNLLGKESIDEIILRKRGIITDGEAIERAKRIAGTLEDVINLPRGTTATTEQMRAIRQIVAEEEGINKALRDLIENGGIGSTRAERDALARLGEGYDKMSEEELLRHAYQESTYKLKKAQIVEMAIGSEAGRTLAGLRKVGDAFDSRMRTLFNRLNTSKKFTDKEKSDMIDLISKLDTRDDKKFLKTLEDIVKPDMFDKIAEWSVAAKLWNPTTHIVNFGGNSIRQLTDIGVSAVTNPRHAAADIHGAVVGFKQGLKNALRAMTDDGYAAQLAKYVETGGTAPAIGGKLGKLVRTPFRALGASDEIFKSIGYQRQLYTDAHEIAVKEGLKGKQLEARMTELLNAPTFTMMERATNKAKHLTFQDDMGEIVGKIERFRNPANYKSKTGKTIGVGVRFFLPFLKTPTNLFKQSLDFSPFGIIKNWKTLREGGDAAKTAIGEAILGTALGTYIVMETLDGNVTGGAPRDTAAKDRFYRENKMPYAIKIGDRWYEYKRIDPFASIIGLTTDAVTLEEKDIGSIFGLVAENLKDKTYLSGMSDMMKMLTGEDWERDYAFKSMILGAAIPSIVGHTARSVDPTIRQVDTFAERAQALIPGMSKELPARVNVLGYDAERANKGLNYFFNPIQSASAEIDPVTRGLMAIDKTVSVPDKSFQREGVKYELSPDEYERFARQVGTSLRRQLAEEFKSPRYQRMTTEEKQARVDKIRREIMDEWKDEYVKRQAGRRPIEEVISEVFGE